MLQSSSIKARLWVWVSTDRATPKALLYNMSVLKQGIERDIKTMTPSVRLRHIKENPQ